MPLVNIDIEKNANQTPDRSHLRRASEHEDAARSAFGRLSAVRQGLRLLFGEPVVVTVDRATEDVTEHQGEAIYHLREHLADITRANSEHTDRQNTVIANQMRSIERLGALLEAAYLDEVKRAKKAKRDLAPWAADAALIVEAPF